MPRHRAPQPQCLQEAPTLLEPLAEAALTRKDYLAELAAVPLLIIDKLGMRKLADAAEDHLSLPYAGATPGSGRISVLSMRFTVLGEI